MVKNCIMRQYGFCGQTSRIIQKNKQSTRRFIPDGRKNSIFQRMAWVATRPLGQIAGDHRKDWNLGFGNLRLNHRHFIFSDNQTLPTGQNDNIGFHCANGGVRGPGALFSEAWRNLGYTGREIVSNTAADDATLVQAIGQHNPPGNYNVITHNCQDWVTEVRQTAGL